MSNVVRVVRVEEWECSRLLGGKAGNLGLGIYMCRRGVVVPVYPAAFRRGVLQDDVLSCGGEPKARSGVP